MADGVLLTAGHCVCNLSIGRDKALITRGYFSPDDELEVHGIGLIAHSSVAESPPDWAIVEALDEEHQADSQRFRGAIQDWGKAQASAAQSPSSSSNAGYLISSPYGFSLHATFGPLHANGVHKIPSWDESSGGPIFDWDTGRLLGIQTHGSFLDDKVFCEKVGPQQECTVVVPNPRNRPVSGRFVGLETIATSIGDQAQGFRISGLTDPAFRRFCVALTTTKSRHYELAMIAQKLAWSIERFAVGAEDFAIVAEDLRAAAGAVIARVEGYGNPGSSSVPLGIERGCGDCSCADP